jgi:predicted RNase H-like HicB family nuclease
MAPKLDLRGKLNAIQTPSAKAPGTLIAQQQESDTLSQYKIEYIPLSQLEPIPYNREVYDVDDLDFIEATIDKYGLLQPLVVRKNEDGETYSIISGERRYRAIVENRKKGGKISFAQGVPCRVFPNELSVEEIKILLILANATGRTRTYENQIKELRELSVQFEEAEKNGVEISFTLKQVAQNQLQVKDRTYQKYQAVLRLIPELEEVREREQIGLNLASAIGAKPIDVQEEIYMLHSEGKSLQEAYDIASEAYSHYTDTLRQYTTEIKELKAEISRLKEIKEDVVTADEKAEVQEQISILQESVHKSKEDKKKVEDKRKNIVSDHVRKSVKAKEGKERAESRKETEKVSPASAKTPTLSTNINSGIAYAESGISTIMMCVTSKREIDDLTKSRILDLKERIDRVASIITGEAAQAEEGTDNHNFIV